MSSKLGLSTRLGKPILKLNCGSGLSRVHVNQSDTIV
jgi:hypothetical protein